MPARLRLAPLFLLAALGCGLHLHRPRDAATAEGADGDLKAARLVDGFLDELAQSQAMAAEELAAAQAWADVGRDRDLLDILAARDESDPEVEPLYFKRCRARYRGDGWTTLCSKISTRLYGLTGHAFPQVDPAPPVAAGKPKSPAPTPAPDPGADLLRELRSLQRHWKGPDSAESRLARAVNEHHTAARALRLGPTDDPPGCPTFDAPGRSPALQTSFERQRGLCRDRRDNLQALAERVVCRGDACGPSELGAVVEQSIAVHDALQQHHDELARRLRAYDLARRPCSDLAALATTASADDLTRAPGSCASAHVSNNMFDQACASTHARSSMSDAPGASGPALSAALSPTVAAPAGVFLGAGLLAEPAPEASPPPAAAEPSAPAGTCDEAVLAARFTALAEIPVPPALVAHDLRPLGELGRRYQLAEQLAAIDALIEAAQRRAGKRDGDVDAAAAAKALAEAPRFARVVHATIVGIDRLQKTVNTLEIAVLALIRETLRVEHDALGEAIAHAERRLRLQRAKLAAQLDEAVLLMEAHASLARLERAGCTAQALMPAYEAGKCRDELTRTLTAFGNAWTLGRAGQKRADALDLAIRHDASIIRSRAAMALRQVYLAAGVTELVKFTRGGMAPEALAQLIVSTVGFGVLAGAVLAP